MSRLSSSVRARIRRTAAGERGMTLIEMLISLVLFSVLMSIAMVTVINLSQSSVDSRLRSESASDVLNVFQGLDRTVRWASAVSTPGLGSSGASYVEYFTPQSATLDNTSPMCTQWRYVPSTGVIQTRNWATNTAGATGTPGVWVTKGLNVTGSASSVYPFELVPATNAKPNQRLSLNVVGGTADAGTQTNVDVEFIARNSSITSVTTICNPTGNRP